MATAPLFVQVTCQSPCLYENLADLPMCMGKRNKKKFRVFCWEIVYAIGQSNDKGVKRYVYSGDVSDEGFLYGEDAGL